MHLEPYLSFDGNCEEALRFYAEVFGGEIVDLNRYDSSPNAGDMPAEARSRIMHASFKSPTLQFMASDGNRATAVLAGSRITLSLTSHDLPESQRVFDALATGGRIDMPFGKTFWGAMFGIVSDRFGIDWMVNCQLSHS